MSAITPNIAHLNKVIDYWPSWFDWHRKSFADYGIGGKKERVDVINIAFALPQKDGTLKWTDVDKTQYGNYQKTKKLIADLKAQGKKVLISLGGGTAKDWNLASDQAIKTLAENVKKFIDEYGLDGVDIDYEGPLTSRPRLSDLVIALRALMPLGRYTISYVAWSIGAYGAENPEHTHPEWNGFNNKGIDIAILKKIGHLLDYISVMCYDAFEPGRHYNPIQAIEAYKSVMGGNASKVIMGLELGLHSWPKNKDKKPFVRTSLQDAKPWIEYVEKNGFGGVMFWTLDYDYGPKKRTKDSEGAFLALTKSIMPKALPSAISSAINYQFDAQKTKSSTQNKDAPQSSTDAKANATATASSSAQTAPLHK